MSRVLIIGDLHCPFDLDGYLDHCTEIYERYDCDKVIFIGDVIDNHYSSYHETDPDGMSGGLELIKAIERLQTYYQAFPDATVIIGNHDRMIMRKGHTSAIPKAWLKDYNEVLGTVGWEWTDRLVIDGVQYVHGESGTARTKCKSDLMSTVQGHLHTQSYIEYIHGYNGSIFGMQVGTGIDFESYAFGYAQRGKRPAISCGVVIDGVTAIVEPYKQQ